MAKGTEKPADPLCGPDEHRAAPHHPRASDADLERASSLFRAVSEVSRLRLLERLADGERCVTELAESLGAGLSTISQQLRLLRSERIVTRRRDGKHIYYALADSHITELIESAISHAQERPDPHADDD